MNKRVNKKSIIFVLTLCIMLFGFINVSAKSSANIKGAHSDEKAAGTSTTKKSLTDSQKDAACKTKLGLNIEVSDYSRDSDYDGGSTYHNDVAPRTIKIHANKNTGKYVVQVYIAEVGNLDKLEKLSDAEKVKASDVTEDDIDQTFEDIEDPNGTVYYRKTFGTGGESYSGTYEGLKPIPAGYEALVIVLSKTKKDSDEWITTTKKGDICATTDSNGNCTAWNKYTITCKKGSIEEKNSNVEELEIKGNAASVYVQNPSDYNVVTNYRAVGSSTDEERMACNNAVAGINSDDSKYNSSKTDQTYPIKANQKSWSDYYNKILGDYCSQTSVAYNLKSSGIKSISNKLLESYYYIRRIQNSTNKDYNTVETYIKNTLIPEVGASNTFTDKSKLAIDLDCNYGNENRDYKNNHSKKYLYYESNKETAEIFNGIKADGSKDYKTIDVCSTICYEKLTVDYAPPVTVKAGICFEYKVTVKSEMECGVNPGTDAIMQIEKRSMCSPQPICGNNSESTQGGPNEEFDTCIQNCDNGKYSQKCINSCYKSIYGNTEKSNNKAKTSSANKTSNVKEITNNLVSNDEVDSINMLVNTINSNSNVQNMGIYHNYKFDDNDLESYYKNDDVKNIKYKNGTINCSTEKITDYVHNGNDNKLNICANFFTEAKILNPMGEYKLNSDTKRFVWKKDAFDDYEPTYGTGNIPRQLGVASPFYLRDADATKELLKSLVCPKGIDCSSQTNGSYRKYSIMKNGIKKQYSARWQCDDKCYYTGCNKKDALTSKEYTETITSDLNKINAALKKCSSTSACEKEEKTTSFTISVNNKRKSSTQDVEKNGTTTMKNSIGNGDSDMFVPADDDTNTETGILGLCYDGRSLPHYQTTITFPGTWINLKTGALTYVPQTADKYLEKKHEYCTAMDSEDTNEKWWSWIEEYNAEASKYPQDFTPEWNIFADLGSKENQEQKFGEYKWNVKFRCFYALYNETCLDCTNKTKESTPINNYNFKIVELEDTLKTATEKNTVGFNWTKAAQTKSILNNPTSSENAKTYAINPEKYKEYVQNEGNKVYSSDNYDYHIYLSTTNLKAIKNYNKGHTYTEYNGTFDKNKTGVEGLTSYYSDIIGNTTYAQLKNSNRDSIRGINNNYGTALGGLLSE